MYQVQSHETRIWGQELVCHCLLVPLQRWLTLEMRVYLWSRMGWNGPASLQGLHGNNNVSSKLIGRKAETWPLRHSYMPGLAVTLKPHYLKIRRCFLRTFVSECLSLGVESFLIHLEGHSFPVTELHSEVLGVVSFSANRCYQTAEITLLPCAAWRLT